METARCWFLRDRKQWLMGAVGEETAPMQPASVRVLSMRVPSPLPGLLPQFSSPSRVERGRHLKSMRRSRGVQAGEDKTGWDEKAVVT